MTTLLQLGQGDTGVRTRYVQYAYPGSHPPLLATAWEDYRSWRETTLTVSIRNALRSLGAPVIDVEIRHDEHLGSYALALLECNARQALRHWLNITDVARELGMPIFVAWTGENDAAPEEAGGYVGRALAKMGVFLRTKGSIDVLKALKEEWS